ncbi:MAG TPA: peptidase U32 family protein [Treponemataceae bacterium]|nr:peptidase U32 family protein [Treponemataceae bacterium]HQL32286.1 peptidase U32 family protein [Treponemataceae bacterium]
MELVAPAGNIEKLLYAWEYGADSAYIGLKKFSLRVKADNFYGEEHSEIARLKEEYRMRGKPKKLLCALNISFHNRDIANFLAEKDYFAQYPIDAFIVQDIGMVRVLQREFPQIPLHLSTQANCVNSEAAKMYRDLGFKRVVLGREAGLAEIREIKDAAPELEIECFAHGAMCIAYSGRCLMSAYLTGRSANSGFCSHSCRWDWRLLADELKTGEREYLVEERERPGEFFPVVETDDFTALFSSKDLCMIDYVREMKNAGVDALKIEGRMKSIYYTALVTRAYRKRIDEVEGRISADEAAPFVAELDNVAHRQFATGFYFDKNEANKTTKGETSSPWILAGTIGKKVPGTDGDWEFVSMNKITAGIPLEFVGPDEISIPDTDYVLIDPETGTPRDWVCHGHPCIIRTSRPVQERFIVRAPAG